MVFATMTLVCLLAQMPPAPRTNGNPALRPQHSELKVLLEQGAARSATFRELVAALNQSTVTVYLNHGVCGSGVPACLRVQGTPPSGPIVLITVDPFDRSRDAQIALVAHELQHAQEIAAAGGAALTAIAKMFETIGWHGRAGFETAEAKRAERDVERELAAHR